MMSQLQLFTCLPVINAEFPIRTKDHNCLSSVPYFNIGLLVSTTLNLNK